MLLCTLEDPQYISIDVQPIESDDQETEDLLEQVQQDQVEHGQSTALPGDKVHTILKLANEGLAYTYKRDTVTIYGNVVKATHGETRQEVLGSGDGNQARQQFALKQSPLTYLAAATPSGAASTLAVRVNDVLWHEAKDLFVLEPNDRAYITRTDNESKTSTIFGDGQHGARLPTGAENVKVVYRSGIGKAGNVAAEQISLLATRPLGVKGVINSLRALGGADRESRDQARRNAPLAVMALDRLASVRDYADFARTYAGIGKASASSQRNSPSLAQTCRPPLILRSLCHERKSRPIVRIIAGRLPSTGRRTRLSFAGAVAGHRRAGKRR